MSKFTNKSYDICARGMQDTPIAKSAIGVAAAAVSVTLTHVGDNSTMTYITGFTVTSTNPASTVSGLVTVTGLATSDSGGTLDYEFVESNQFGGNLNVQFPDPIPAANLTTDIVVSCPAIAGGGAVAVAVTGFKTAY